MKLKESEQRASLKNSLKSLANTLGSEYTIIGNVRFVISTTMKYEGFIQQIIHRYSIHRWVMSESQFIFSKTYGELLEFHVILQLSKETSSFLKKEIDKVTLKIKMEKLK